MARSKSEDYAQALEQLEQLHRSGQISDARYELHKQKLLSEASRPKRSLGVRILIWVAIVIVLFFVLRFLISIWNIMIS